ncbi:hypothetical protein Bca101_074515 [Brassica carinata]
MCGGTSCSTWLAECLNHMQDNTPTSIWPSSGLELMQGDTPSHTCRSACFGCIRNNTSCLVNPPRASTCQAACTTSMHGDTSSFCRNSACSMVDTTF